MPSPRPSPEYRRGRRSDGFDDHYFARGEGEGGGNLFGGEAVFAWGGEGDGLGLVGEVDQAVGGDGGVGVHGGEDGDLGAAGGQGGDVGFGAEEFDEVEPGGGVEAGGEGEDGALADGVEGGGGGAVLVGGEDLGGGGGEGVGLAFAA